MTIVVLLAMFVLASFLLYRGFAYLAWVAPVALGLLAWWTTGPAAPALFVPTVIVAVALAAVFGFAPLRQQVLSRRILTVMQGMLPKLSETERLALEAGTIWWDGEIFSGRPNWKKMLGFEVQPLTNEEREFLAGPVDTLCAMLDEDRIAREQDLPPEAWEFIKRERFMGMIIPKVYGGLGFSAQMHSEVVTRISSRSVAASVTVMVPNSLGPAELLLHYGTEEQKRYYLPRLARGEEVPCFALTEPEAGSDAASGRSRGVICRGTYEGKDVLGMRLTWDKRYATLCPVATVIGLSFRLEDPDGLLGDQKDIGITCALIPTSLPGVEHGQRHDPLGVPFMNGPTTGRNVFVPLDFIIGGAPMAGQGWRMLMESLAAGRSISLPALSTGGAQLAARMTGAYATIRRQFGLSIGDFEGVEERLGRIAGLTYLMDGARRLTAGAVDAGEKPAVVSAIVKAYMTESMRIVVNDAMDVTAGAGICRGPRNVQAMSYLAVPIGITVEGANILTRCLIVFGQGAIRSHPYVLTEVHAAGDNDLARFDQAFWKHVGMTVCNVARGKVLGWTHGRPAATGPAPLAGYVGQLSRFAAVFSVMGDVLLGTLGGGLKRREMLSGRMADAMAWIYLGAATVKRYRDEGERTVDLPLARWALEHALHECQEAQIHHLYRRHLE